MRGPAVGIDLWPLVGRSGELRVLDRVLGAAGTAGAVLAGAPGVGKTRLALECVQRAERAGLPTARATATRATADLPFGAVAPLLPSAGASESAAGTERADLLRRFAAALADRAGEQRLVLLVDDAHLLDEASAALVYQLAQGGTTLLLATVRTGEPAPDPITALWKDGLLERVEVEGLDGESLDGLLTAVLGGPVDPAAVVRLASRCQGNVLFFRELVLGALRAGTFVDDGGLWRLNGPLAASGRLVELVESRLVGLTAPERALLEAVAVAEPLGTAELAALADLDVAESLERAGLLASRMDGRRLVLHLAHPLHGEVLRQQMSALRRRILSRTLAEVIEATGARRAEDPLRLATWRLDAGGADSDGLLAAAAVARRRYDFPFAERLVRAAVQAGAGFPAAVEAAQLAGFSGRTPQAERELEALAGRAVGDAERALVAGTRMDVLRLIGRVDDALAVAGEAERALAGSPWADDIAGRHAMLLLETTGPSAAATAADAVRARSGGPGLLWACLVSALSHARAGRLEPTAQAAAQGLQVVRALAGADLQWPPGVLNLAAAEAMAYGGRLDEAQALATAEHANAVADGSVDAQAYAAWQLARIHLAQGRAASAAGRGREAAALLRRLDRRLLLGHCLVPLAAAEALRGDPGAANEILGELTALQLPASHWTGVDLLSARAWTAVAGGDLGTAHDLLHQAASLGRAGGDRVGEAAALHDLARLGYAREVSAVLAAVAAEVEGNLVEARAAHAAALVAKDAVGLETAAAAFEGLGALLLGAEAAVDAAVAWRKRGDPRRAAASGRRAGALADCCEGAATPALQDAETRALLTPAERQVALLAAAGRSNREIAASLYLSPRTVENRLHRIYEKLGVSGRAGLAAALAT